MNALILLVSPRPAPRRQPPPHSHHICTAQPRVRVRGFRPDGLVEHLRVSCFLRRLASCSLAARSCHGIDAVCRASRGQGQGRTHGAMGGSSRECRVCGVGKDRGSERLTRRATRGEAAGSVVVARRTARVLRVGWLAAGCMGLATPTSHLAYYIYIIGVEVRRHEGDSDTHTHDSTDRLTEGEGRGRAWLMTITREVGVTTGGRQRSVELRLQEVFLSKFFFYYI